jgi:hypothetical protein
MSSLPFRGKARTAVDLDTPIRKAPLQVRISGILDTLRADKGSRRSLGIAADREAEPTGPVRAFRIQVTLVEVKEYRNQSLELPSGKKKSGTRPGGGSVW